MLARVVVLLLFGIVACSSRVAPINSAPSPAGGVTAVVPAVGGTTALTLAAMPQRTGGFSITDSVRYPEASLGTLYRYRDGSPLQPDVYVYPLTEVARRGTTPALQAKAECEMFKAVLDIQRQQGAISGYQIVGEGFVESAAAAQQLQGYQIHATISRGTDVRDTHQQIFVIGDRLVKFRMTYVRGAVTAAAMNSFVRGLVGAIVLK